MKMAAEKYEVPQFLTQYCVTTSNRSHVQGTWDCRVRPTVIQHAGWTAGWSAHP